jgi:hypothetical protein
MKSCEHYIYTVPYDVINLNKKIYFLSSLLFISSIFSLDEHFNQNYLQFIKKKINHKKQYKIVLYWFIQCS